MSVSSISTYFRVVAALEKLAPGKKLTELDGDDIERFKEWLGTRAKMTQKGYATALRRLLEWLADEGHEPNPDAVEGLLTLKRKKFMSTINSLLGRYLNPKGPAEALMVDGPGDEEHHALVADSEVPKYLDRQSKAGHERPSDRQSTWGRRAVQPCPSRRTAINPLNRMEPEDKNYSSICRFRSP